MVSSILHYLLIVSLVNLFDIIDNSNVKNNKTDIQYLYNPIELACQNYLTKSCLYRNSSTYELFAA